MLNTILAVLAGLLLAAGALGWIWSGNWKIGASAFVLVFAVALVASQLAKSRGMK